MEPVLFIICALVAIGAIAFAFHKYEQGRTQQFEALARELGLDFYLKGDETVVTSLGQMRLFSRGRRRRARNMLCGHTQDVEIAIFGYQYTVGGGKNQRTYRQSVVSLRSPNLGLPEFELRPEGVFHKIGQAFGYRDIDFDSHPQFSRQYLLRGEDEGRVRQCFTRDVLDFFEATRGVSVEARYDRLIFYRAGKRIKPEEVRSFMEEGFHLYGLLKSQEA